MGDLNYLNRTLRFWIVLFSSLLSIGLLVWGVNYYSGTSGSEHDEGNGENKEKILWGVDSANYTTNEFYKCVVDHFGKPAAWGRYIETKEEVSMGLDKDEVAFFHEKEISIIPIYNSFSDATGYENGQKHAKQAIEVAGELGVEDDVYLFADIEPTYPVDAAFIQGWTDALVTSQYGAGIYGVFDKGSDLYEAFHAAASDNEKVAKDVVIWTSYPQEGVTTKEKAPAFNPSATELGNALIWQYGINGKACNIDTNLLSSEIVKGMW